MEKKAVLCVIYFQFLSTKSDVEVGSHDPYFGSNYFSGIVSANRNVNLRH